MTQELQGFFLEQIAVGGPLVETTSIEFSDGLNVVAGASDTGKSYLCSLVDFVFGASSIPRVIKQAERYSHVIARLRDRRSKDLYEIERNLNGGDATVRRLDNSGLVIERRIAGAKHNADDATTLSAFLLELSGFGSVRVRKNKKGETRTLSFRDIAFLVVVDETRIISENPPHLSGSPMEKTVEGEVFHFLVAGIPSAEPILVPRKATAQSAKAQLELMRQLINQAEDEVETLQLSSLSIDEELTQLGQTRAEFLNSYESSRVELGELEREMAKHSRVLRDAESRLVVVEGLLRRFELLDRHYESDIERLSAIEEAGSMLEALPAKACPVCGAPPEEHRPDQAAEHFQVENIRQAAIAEREKTGRLRIDLQQALSELTQDATTLEEQSTRVRNESNQIRLRIAEEVLPRVHTSAQQLQAQDSRRDVLVRGRVLTEQLDDLRRRGDLLEAHGSRRKSSPVMESGPTTAGMEAFARQVQDVLTAWNFPDTGRVVFSEKSQDLVVGDQPRVSHGKGVRALTCSAFIAGLMRHCLQGRLAHPGLIVLDSPLVAYKDPDRRPGNENAVIREAGVKDAFYRALANGLCLGQVIILENEDPPSDVALRATHHHFSKGAIGRYGFFP